MTGKKLENKAGCGCEGELKELDSLQVLLSCEQRRKEARHQQTCTEVWVEELRAHVLAKFIRG